MKAKPILEPRDVDLTIDGGDLTAADRKAIRALLHERSAEIANAQAKADAQPWISEPVPTLQQLVALQHKLEEARQREQDPLPKGTLDIDESGIGGSPTEQENAYTSAYIWSTRSPREYGEAAKPAAILREPAPRYKAGAPHKTKRKLK
jgi:hypothetical protein